MQSDVDQRAGGVEERVHIRPLTRRTTEGKAYLRSASVESQLESALALDPGRLLERASSIDYRSSDYLQEECLVYLIREYKRRDQDSIVNDLAQILLHRCAKFINNRLRLGPDTVEEAFHDVIQELFIQILDLDSDRGDFLQVRFWKALQVIVVSTFNRYKKQQFEEANKTVPLSSLAGYERDADASSSRTSVPLEDHVDSSLSMEQRILYQEGLNALEDPYRTAFVLRHYYAWPIESSDPSLPTISRYFNRTSRTIRTWLSQAEEALDRWRGENNETAQ